MMDVNVRTILVYVDGDLMGDGLMKLPMLRALRAAHPHAHITWCAGKYRSVFATELASFARGLIDEVIEQAFIAVRPWQAVRRPLAGRHFDLVIDTQNSLLRALQLRRISHDRFISVAARFLLSDWRPSGASLPLALSERLVRLTGVSADTLADPRAVPLPLEIEQVQAAAAVLPEGYVYVGLAPGAGGRYKCWPLERYIALAHRQAEKGRVPVFILGPNEADWAEDIARAVPSCVIPASGDSAGRRCSLSPAFTVAVGQRLALAVANDSGCGHLLAAADVPLISLFGSTSPEKFRPSARHAECIEARTFGAGNISDIPIAAVESAIERMLGHWQAAPAA